MKHIITKVQYRSVFSTGGYYDLKHIKGFGTLEITEDDSDNGLVRTYKLSTPVRRMSRTGDASLDADMQIIVYYDSGLRALIGTSDRPARMSISDSDYPVASCTWKEAVERLP